MLATSSDLLARILLLAGLYPGYFYASQVFSFSVFAGIASVCIALSSLLCILYYWQSDYAYRSQDNAGEQLGWQFDRLVVDSLAWCGVAGSILFLGHVTLQMDFLHLLGDQWAQDAGLLMLMAWLVCLLANWLQMARWSRLVPGGLR